MMSENKDFSDETWLSLLGLLKPLEYLVTLDNMPVWRRHLAWAKTDGAELRQHVIQRFSSNMVFLSLMMGSALMVLFNSCEICSAIRQAITDNEWATLKFWIGLTIIVSVCVTISALVATFTAWGMVSAISDANVHCILRSSIGQYVCHLPSRLVLTALYMFLLWIILSAIELTHGLVSFVLVSVILSLFFQVVVTFSAFGRLIVHTGAMGKKPILEPDLERALLPSGLHASLLIKATNHQRRQTGVIMQYKSPRSKLSQSVRSTSDINSSTRSMGSLRDSSARSNTTGRDFNSSLRSIGSVGSNNSSTRGASPSRTSVNGGSSSSRHARESPVREVSAIPLNNNVMSPVSDGSPDVVLKTSRTRVNYSKSLPPTAPTTKERTKSRPGRMMRDATDKVQDEVSNNPDTLTSLDEDDSEKRRSIDLDDLMSIEKFATSMGRSPDGRGSGSHRSSFARRQSLLLGSRRMSSQVIMEEWQEDADARNIYDADPPAELITEEDELFEDDLGESWHQDDVALPRASLLNRARKLESLRKLASGEDNEDDDSFRDLGNFTPRTSMGGLRRPPQRGAQRGSALSNMMVPVASFFKAVSSFGPDPNDSYGNFGESATLDLMEEGSVETDYLLNDSSNQSRKGSLSSVQSSSSTERRNQPSPRVRNQGQGMDAKF